MRRRAEETQGPQMRRGRLRQGVHEEFSPEGAQENSHRRETVPVHVGGLHVEIRAFRRIDAALSQAHGPEAVQVPSLSAIVFTERSLIAAHEKALIKRTVLACRSQSEKKRQRDPSRWIPGARNRNRGRRRRWWFFLFFRYIRDLKSLASLLESSPTMRTWRVGGWN